MITFNAILTNLTGVENIDANSISNLSIYNNIILSVCDVQSICDYLASPNGTIEIHDNASGCNSQVEVDSTCTTVSIETINFKDEFISTFGRRAASQYDPKSTLHVSLVIVSCAVEKRFARVL